MVANKIIALGDFCDNSTAPLVYVDTSWSKPSKWKTTKFAETKTYDAPQFTTCLYDAAKMTVLTYEFKDKDSQETLTKP